MPSPRHILALDQGTTSSRAMIFDHDANVLAVEQRATTQKFPHPGWVNQDAAEIWNSTRDTARDALARTRLSGEQIAAIGVTNQRETLVVWDRATSTPVAPAIVWQSRQSQPQIDALIDRGMADRYQELTGLIPDAYFTASKLAWLLEEDPDFRRRADDGEILGGTIDSWLLWNLTGGKLHATDVSNASRTMLFDIHHMDWSPELLTDLRIPRTILPKVVPSAAVIGVTDPNLFGNEIPIAGIAGDQQAALFGQTCFAAGEAKNTYGTGSFLLMNTGAIAQSSQHGLLSTVAWQIESDVTYALEGAIYVSGAAISWLRDGLGIIAAPAEVDALAASVPDTGGVMFVPALTGLGAPHWDSAARGTILGITRGTAPAHLARATLEAIALQTRDVTDAMVADSGIPLGSLRVDGGASRGNLLMQLQADVLGVPVIRPANVETTALGAAFLAGLGSGFWPDQSALTHHWRIDRIFEPTTSEDERHSRYAAWQRAVARSLDWAT
jgi:glycerol kinase